MSACVFSSAAIYFILAFSLKLVIAERCYWEHGDYKVHYQCRNYCCRMSNSHVDCCSDCDKSIYSNNCGSSNLWKYVMYGILGLIALVAVGFGLFYFLKYFCKGCKDKCNKKQSQNVRPSGTRLQVSYVNYPRQPMPSSSTGGADNNTEYPSKPPGFYEIFRTSSPPPGIDDPYLTPSHFEITPSHPPPSYTELNTGISVTESSGNFQASSSEAGASAPTEATSNQDNNY